MPSDGLLIHQLRNSWNLQFYGRIKCCLVRVMLFIPATNEGLNGF